MAVSRQRDAAAPSDQEARDRIESVFDRNFLVEAGAGSGKTHSLARRMAAGIADGVYAIEHMAAVTFTRKAAAELRGRFQEALEDRLAGCPDRDGRPTRVPPEAERVRLEEALGRIERLFAGTIHAFCAHLLRERPVEARMAPGFVELDEVEDARRRRRAWREFVVGERAAGSAGLLALKAAGVRPGDLDQAFAMVCGHEDVDFPAGEGRPPDLEAAWAALEAFWKALAPLVPADVDPEAKCKALPLAREFGPRFDWAKRWRREPAMLAGFVDEWRRARVTMTWWGAAGREARDLVDRFQKDTAEPFTAQWRQYVYRLAVKVLIDARAFYADERRRQNVVNYVDLLLVTARLLRDNVAVRRALQRKYRWFFIDEFQDTDPIQAEIFLLLGSALEGGETAVDAFSAPLKPGALFVVGDPKQSIYRFRRADIDIYNRVRERIEACGGSVLHLTANWRSLAGVCELANTVFPNLFPPAATRESPAFEPLDPRRLDPEGVPGPRLARLVVPAAVEKSETASWEAERIARYIKAEVASGRRTYGSFLVLTRYKPRLVHYSDAFDRHEIPVEVSGAGRFGGSSQVVALAAVLASLADPLDGASLVGVVRGPFFGISDPELFAFRQAGGRFELTAPLVGVDGERLLEAERNPERAGSFLQHLDHEYGPALTAIRTMRRWRRLTERLPLGAAVDAILEESGWLALAATSPGGANAGDLLQAVDCVRQVFESGGGLADAADALVEDEEVSTEVEALPLEPGKRDVVRLMNLHKAKGLEGKVVFLADPVHGRRFDPELRIIREGDHPVGYFTLAREREGKFGKQTLGAPVGWDFHEQEEKRYGDAEVNRLLYVAATRARDLLVVGQWARRNSKGRSQNEAWGEFDTFLEGVAEIEVPEPVIAGPPLAPDVTPSACAAARQRRAAALDDARRSSWSLASVTGEHRPIRTTAARVREAIGEWAAASAGSVPGVESDRAPAAAPLAEETPTDRADAGAAWGSLIHGLLEHAMRHRGTTRGDLERLGKWLTVEAPELRPHLAEALDVVDAVSKSAVWQQARASGATHVEVPFAVRRAGSAPGSNGQAPMPTVVRGVIDLVYHDDGGWRILDYKTDRVVGGAAELLERHGAQLDEYVAAWQEIAGEQPAGAGIFGVRDLDTAWKTT